MKIEYSHIPLFLMSAITLLLCTWTWYFTGDYYTEKWREKTIKKGYAEYFINDDNKIEWRWKSGSP